jgi:Tol biopolymer transport system component
VFGITSRSPDGKRLAGVLNRAGGPIYGIVVFSFDTGKYDRLTDFGTSPFWLGDSRRLVFISDPGRDKILIVDSQTKKWHEIFSVPPGFSVDNPALSKDGSTLYFDEGANGSDIWLLTWK